MVRETGTISGMIVNFQKTKCKKGKCTVKFGHGAQGETMAERKINLPKGMSDKDSERVINQLMKGTYIDI